MSETISPRVTIAPVIKTVVTIVPVIQLKPQSGLPAGPSGRSITWKGEYDTDAQYFLNDAVSKGGSSYICIKYSKGNPVTDEEFWNLLAKKGNDSDTIEVATGAKQTGVDSGYLGQESITDDYLYKCVQAGTGISDGSGTSIWKKLLMFQT